MNVENAKRTLLSYRPGTADADEPEFAEALQLVRQEEGLRQWFDDQSSVREMIRLRFKQIQIPEGLKEQILSERPWKTLVIAPQEVLAMAAFVGVALLLGFALLWSRPHPPENRLLAFEKRMIGNAQRAYGMDLATNDLNQVRAYLAEHHAHADYLLPEGLDNASMTGCVITSWQGNSVSMICFKTGRPLAAGQSSDLWLFIADRSALKVGVGKTPEISQVNGVAAASWAEDEKIYVLAVQGDEALLRNYF